MDKELKTQLLTEAYGGEVFPDGRIFGLDAGRRDQVSNFIDEEALEGRGVPEHSSPPGRKYHRDLDDELDAIPDVHGNVGVVSSEVGRALVLEADRLRIQLGRLGSKTHTVFTRLVQEDGSIARYAYGPYAEGEARRLRDSFISASERGGYSIKFECFALKLIDAPSLEARAHQDLVADGT